MKFTLSWLKDHLETEASLDEVVEALTMVGLEVEEVSDPSAPLKPFVVAKVVTADKHPNADKLKLLSVDAGKGPVQVVCGAPNARAGLKGVFALPGMVIPATGAVLEVGTIRGVESRGMMCSERELGLSDEHNGIIELPEDAPIGVSFADYRGGADPVIDISITPNRGELAQVVGAWHSEDELERKAQALRQRLNLQALLLTRSEEGMSLFTAEGVGHIQAQAREVADVTGAGDTVIATLALMLACGLPLHEAMLHANRAGGLVVAKFGTATLSYEELFT